MRAATRNGDDQRGKPRREVGNGDRGEGQRQGGAGGEVEVRKGEWRNMKEAVVEELAKGLKELGEALVKDQQSRHPVGCVQVGVEEPVRSQEERECQPAA